MTGDIPPMVTQNEPARDQSPRLRDQSLSSPLERTGAGESGRANESEHSTMELLAQNAWGPSQMNFQSGQIESIKLPDGWVKGGAGGSESSTYREFHPEGENSDSRMEFFYRGQRVPEREGERFKEMLKNKGHELSRPEFMSLGSILRGKENPADFQLDRAWVDEVNSRPVLMIEGKYTENGKKSMMMLIDADKTGTAVQEVALGAPETKYGALKPEFEKSLKSIEWKEGR
ncbi:MAG TPA: hypothetical protein PKD05_19025 [Candidatus Melainabacteria bacterium]|nr:hypothetical protein [Candidatus Melainabacteria bacterium]